MKNFNKLAIFTFAMFGFTAAANAQVTATSTSSATIVAPITITKTVDMNFGKIAAGTGGTVVLNPVDGVRSKTGGVTLPSTIGTVAAASFDITGEAGNTYSITLPTTNHTITGTGTTPPTMIVNAFTSSPSATGTLSTAGTQTVKVGATLNVTSGQKADTYISGTGFDVTVNYN